MKKLLSILLVIAWLCLSGGAMAEGEGAFAFVNASRVNLRKSPGGDIITRLDQDTCVAVIDSKMRGDKLWHRVIASVDNDSKVWCGWMDASFLTDATSVYENVVQAAVGNRHVLLRMEDGSVAAFGFPFRNNLDVDGWGRVRDVTAARFASYGLSEDGMNVFGDAWNLPLGTLPLTSLHGNASSDYVSAVTASGRLISSENPFAGGGWYRPFAGSLDDAVIMDASTTMSVSAVITEEHVLHVAVEADYIEGVAEAEGLAGVRDAVCAGRSVFALMEDGTVRCFGSFDWPLIERVNGWRNVRCIAAGNGFVAALLDDGTVSFAGSMSMRNWNYRVESSERRINLQDEGMLAEWTDIVSIAAGDHILVGVTEDGGIRIFAAFDYE